MRDLENHFGFLARSQGEERQPKREVLDVQGSVRDAWLPNAAGPKVPGQHPPEADLWLWGRGWEGPCQVTVSRKTLGLRPLCSDWESGTECVRSNVCVCVRV